MKRVGEAASYIARDKPAAAVRWAGSVFDRVESLAELPNQGRVVPELSRSDVRELIHSEYRIIYRVEGGSVFFLTVRHARRRFESAEAQTE